MEKQTLGTTIKNYRKQNNISLRKFSDEIGCTYETIRKIETDAEIPSFKILEKISKVLNIPFHKLLQLVYLKVEYNGKNYYKAYLTDNEIKERMKLI